MPEVFTPTKWYPQSWKCLGICCHSSFTAESKLREMDSLPLKIPLSGALLGSFFRILTLNQEIFCAWSVQAFMINTWKGQRPKWLQGWRQTAKCSTAGRNAEKDLTHPPFAYLPPVHLFPCKSSCLWATWEWNRNLKRAPVLQAVSVLFAISKEEKLGLHQTGPTHL